MNQVAFKVVEGKSKGKDFTLKPGECCAICRSLDKKTETKLLSIYSNISLDEISKNVVMQYVSSHFNKLPQGDSQGKQEVGGFRRLRDFHLTDSSVSRLHSMMFCEKTGAGVVDLVSKNGTFVNGVEVESTSLKNDDLIKVGNTKIRVSISE